MQAEINISKVSDGYAFTLHCNKKMVTGTFSTLRETLLKCEAIIGEQRELPICAYCQNTDKDNK